MMSSEYIYFKQSMHKKCTNKVSKQNSSISKLFKANGTNNLLILMQFLRKENYKIRLYILSLLQRFIVEFRTFYL